MNILITGASGFIGQHIMKHCLQQGHNVTACGRHPAHLLTYFPGIQTFEIDFSNARTPEDWLPKLKNIDAVINCVGIIREQGQQTFAALHTISPCALFKACEIAKIKKVIQISALGADNTAFSQYHLTKKAADDFLVSLKLNWTIIKPSIVYGHGAKSMTFFKALAALPFTPLIAQGDQLVQPLHVDDLCLSVHKALSTRLLDYQGIDAIGPEPISMRQLYCTLKTWLGIKQKRFFNIPYGLSLFVAGLGEIMGNTPMTRAAVQMLQNGNTGNVEKFVEATGITPRSLENTIMSTPPLANETAYAKRFFLYPLLRISLAFLWIITAYVSAFAYPKEQSFAMLASLGIDETLAPLALHSAAVMDFILGLALLINYRVKLVLKLQILLIVCYSILITMGMPELWAHPFGPVSKNIPLLVCSLLILTTART